MLVLTRRTNQSIMIGDDVVVTVLEVKGDQVRIGISAPREVQVHREEVLALLATANRSSVLSPAAAASSAPSAPAPAPVPAAVPAPREPALAQAAARAPATIAHPAASPAALAGRRRTSAA